MNKFYITTTLPYVNDNSHIGFALEIIQADAIARYHRTIGEEVIFNFGLDEHGLKIYRKAQEMQKNPQEYCDEFASAWNKLKEGLGLSYTNFIRTTDKHHVLAAQEFWKRCLKNGDIYKKNYKAKYCVGCELEKTDSELTDGRCPVHPNLEVETIEEENYFFRFSKYQERLLDFYEKHADFVMPEVKFNEIKSFVKSGLNDFSISRLKTKMPWGIDVPDDPDHVMYVWFDALINYISTLDWPEDLKKFQDFWPGIQVAGKDNLRQQTAIWQAMLMSAGLPNSKQIFIHGFITVNGQKISKSLGNVVNPLDLVKKYGTDPIRYYLLSQIPNYDDGDFSEERLKEVYNADLANGLGNLAARAAKLCEREGITGPNAKLEMDTEVQKLLQEYKFNEALHYIWEKIRKEDVFFNEKQPWKQRGQELKETLLHSVKTLQQIAIDLQPFLPETAEKLRQQFSGSIKTQSSLFPRLYE